MNKPSLYRSEIVYNMCLTMRHDYGAPTRCPDTMPVGGMTEAEKQCLWRDMEQVFEHCVEPVLIEHGLEVLP